MSIAGSFTTPGGEEMVVLPRAEYERLVADAEDTRDVAEADEIMARVRAGEEEVLPLDFVRRLALEEDNPVKAWRKYRGLSQAELAARIGASTVYISQIETGRRTGSVQLLRKIAEALGVDLDDIA